MRQASSKICGHSANGTTRTSIESTASLPWPGWGLPLAGKIVQAPREATSIFLRSAVSWKPSFAGPKASSLRLERSKTWIDESPGPPDVGVGVYSNLQAGESGKIFFRKEDPPPTPTSGGPGDSSIHVFDLTGRKDEAFGPANDGFQLTADRKKILVASRGAWTILPASGKPQPGQGKLAVDSIEVRVVPLAEWPQIFDEAWRINRDFFYDPNFHGADWGAMKAKYAAFLPHLACRADLNRHIQWMCSELAVGHHRVGGGDFPGQPARVAGGLLGADYAVENGRYRFKKIYGGLNLSLIHISEPTRRT